MIQRTLMLLRSVFLEVATSLAQHERVLQLSCCAWAINEDKDAKAICYKQCAHENKQTRAVLLKADENNRETQELKAQSI